MLATERAVLIRYMRDGEPRRGSGLRVGGRFVLTADHCANGTDHRVIVGGQEHPAIAHVRSDSTAVDVAVLQTPGLPEIEPLDCALVDRQVATRLEGCQALGFPVWKGSPDRPLLAQASGYVPTSEGLDPQAAVEEVPLMTLKIIGAEVRGYSVLPGGLDQPGSQWAGMSGAVLVTADDLLVGVVRSHTLAEGGQSLTVTPLGAINALPPAKAALVWAALHVPDPSALPRVPLPAEVPAAVSISASQVVVGEIPRQPAAFVAREVVARLAEAVGWGQVAVVCAVTGLRGVGKTQVAAAYARTCVIDGWGLVGWVNADTRDGLLGGLARVAERLGVADPNGDSLESAHRLREHLQTRSGEALLVFDNATDPDGLRPFLPATGGVQVVITSTDLAFGELGQPVDVVVFSRLESLDYLRARTGLSDDTGCAVAHELGDLPLALAQAAATIRRQHLTYRSTSSGCVGYRSRRCWDASPGRSIRGQPRRRCCCPSRPPKAVTRRA